jgi:hypothetical protein
MSNVLGVVVLFLLITHYISLITPALAVSTLPACPQRELNYMESVGLVTNPANCPGGSVCVTSVSGDVLMCNKPKANLTSPPGNGICPGNPNLYSVTTPPNSQSCPVFKKSCLIPGSRPTYVCIPDDAQGICDPNTDSNCPSAKGVECSGGVLTALGCVKTEPAKIISSTVGVTVGLGGGISLLLMAYGAYQMITSGGNPEKLKQGRERFLAAAIGLTFITLAVFLLQIIGVDILNLPGFSR